MSVYIQEIWHRKTYVVCFIHFLITIFHFNFFFLFFFTSLACSSLYWYYCYTNINYMLFEQSQDFLSLNIKNIWHCVTYASVDVILFIFSGFCFFSNCILLLMCFSIFPFHFVLSSSSLTTRKKIWDCFEIAVEESVAAMHNDIKKI